MDDQLRPKNDEEKTEGSSESVAAELLRIDPVITNNELRDYLRTEHGDLAGYADKSTIQGQSAELDWLENRVGHSDELVRAGSETDSLITESLKPPSKEELGSDVDYAIRVLRDGASDPSSVRELIYGPRDDGNRRASSPLTIQEMYEYLAEMATQDLPDDPRQRDIQKASFGVVTAMVDNWQRTEVP